MKKIKNRQFSEKYKKNITPLTSNVVMNNYFSCLAYDQITTEMIRNVVMKDYQVQSKISQRTANALDFTEIYNIDEVKEEISEYVKKVFTSIDVNKKVLMNLLLNYAWFGSSAIHVIWKDERLIDLKEIPSERFKNYENSQLSGEIKDNYGELYPLNFDEFSNPCNFLFYKNKDFKSDLTCLYNYCAFRKRIVELWDRAFDKSSIPAIVATLNDNFQKPDEYETTQEFIDLMSESIESIRSGAGIVLTGIKEITTLNNNISSTNFEIANNMIDEAISLVILGSGRTTNSQNKGSYASDKTSEEAIYRLAKEDNQLLEQFLNILIKWQVWARFGYDEKAPQILFDREKSATLEELNNAIDRGVEISAEAYYKKIDKPKNETDILKYAVKDNTVKTDNAMQFSELPRLKFNLSE